MPANKILFADYARNSKPKRVYSDSSFAIDLLHYEINHTNPAAVTVRQLASFKFYQQLMQDGVEIVGSVFTFTEALHYYTFIYPKRGMYVLSEKFLAAQPAAARLKLVRQKAFKHFLNNYPVECDKAWRTISYRVGATEEFFKDYKIRLIHPLPSPGLSNITKDVLAFAAILKDYFVAVEATDSLHLSISTYLDCDAVISLDGGLCTVDNFTVYAFV